MSFWRSPWLRRLSVGACVSFTALAIAGCERLYPVPGGVLVAVTSNLAPSRDFQGFYLQALDDESVRTLADRGIESRELQATAESSDFSFPLTFSVEGDPKGRDEEKPQTARVRMWLMQGTEYRDGRPRILFVRDLLIPIPPQGVHKMLRVSLDWISMTTSPKSPLSLFPQDDGAIQFPQSGDCPESEAQLQTRVSDGSCVNAAVGTNELDRTLTDIDLTTVFGGGDALDSPDASCFDAPACFANAAPVALELGDDGCFAQLPAEMANVENLSVAIDTTGSDLALERAIEAKRAELVSENTSDNNIRVALEPSIRDLYALRCVVPPGDKDLIKEPLPAGGCGDEMAAGRAVVFDSEIYAVEGGKVKFPQRLCDRFSAVEQDGTRVFSGTKRVWLSAACSVAKSRAVPLCLQDRVVARINPDRRIKP